MKDWHFTAGAQQLHFQNRLSCSFSGFICSVHLRLESSEPHLAGVSFSTPPTAPLIRAQHRKVLCNIWAFRWWCAVVSPGQESGHTHTRVLQHAENIFCRLPTDIWFLPAVQIEMLFKRQHEMAAVSSAADWRYVSVCVKDVKGNE